MSTTSLKLNHVYTYSVYDIEKNSYEQKLRPTVSLVGEIDECLLNLLIKFNEFGLRHFLELEECSELENSILQIVDFLLEQLKEKAPEIYDLPLVKKAEDGKKGLLNLFLDKQSKEACQIRKTYGTRLPDANAYKVLKEKGDFSEIVNFLFKANRSVLPFAVMMATTVASTLFIVFMENVKKIQQTRTSTTTTVLNDEEKRDLLLDIIGSQLQRKIHDNDCYHAMLRFVNKDNKYKHTEIKSLEKEIFESIKNNKSVRATFPILCVKKYDPKTRLESCYNVWENVGTLQSKIPMLKSLNFDPQVDIIPFIFGLELEELERKKIQMFRLCYTLVKNMRAWKIENMSFDLQLFVQKFSMMFDFFVFPNREICEKTTEKNKKIYNDNRFHVEMKEFLSEILKTNVDTIKVLCSKNGINIFQE